MDHVVTTLNDAVALAKAASSGSEAWAAVSSNEAQACASIALELLSYRIVECAAQRDRTITDDEAAVAKAALAYAKARKSAAYRRVSELEAAFEPK